MTATAPTVRVELLIRCPPAAAFSAFVQPELLTRFWLSKASDALAKGRVVHWDFMVPGASASVTVEELVDAERIRIRWDDGTRSEWTFREQGTLGGTVVTVTQWGFQGAPEEVVAQALEATSGFALVLAELKVLLEQGTAANIVRDKAALLSAARSH